MSNKIKKIKSDIQVEEPKDIEPYCEISELKRKTRDFDDDLLEY